MRYAAFLRNVNLGRPKSPTRSQLEAAFLDAGAASAVSFQVNGTLVFTLAPGARPRAVASRACEALAVRCDMREPVFVRSVDELRVLVDADPFAGQVAEGLDSLCISFLGAPRKALAVCCRSRRRAAISRLLASRRHARVQREPVARQVGRLAECVVGAAAG